MKVTVKRKLRNEKDEVEVLDGVGEYVEQNGNTTEVGGNLYVDGKITTGGSLFRHAIKIYRRYSTYIGCYLVFHVLNNQSTTLTSQQIIDIVTSPNFSSFVDNSSITVTTEGVITQIVKISKNPTNDSLDAFRLALNDGKIELELANDFGIVTLTFTDESVEKVI